MADQVDKLRDGYFMGPSNQRADCALPDGSIYHETDTGLIFRVEAGDWSQVLAEFATPEDGIDSLGLGGGG